MTLDEYCQKIYGCKWRRLDDGIDIYFKHKNGRVVRLSSNDGYCYDIKTNQEYGGASLNTVFEIHGTEPIIIELGGE
jgi:hypothetical protein